MSQKESKELVLGVATLKRPVTLALVFSPFPPRREETSLLRRPVPPPGLGFPHLPKDLGFYGGSLPARTNLSTLHYNLVSPTLIIPATNLTHPSQWEIQLPQNLSIFMVLPFLFLSDLPPILNLLPQKLWQAPFVKCFMKLKSDFLDCCHLLSTAVQVILQLENNKFEK